MVKVSIIVPIYNVEKYLARCLDSLVNQTLDSYELILINDGSTDNSQAIVDMYAAKFPKKIKAYYKPNEGIGAARNDGISRATGEYIGFVDSDDWVSTDMFNLLYENAKRHNSDIACCGYREIFPTIENFHLPRYPSYGVCRYKIEVVPWNKVIKADFIRRNNLSFLVGVIHEDFNYITKLLTLTNNISFLDDYLYNYNRLNLNSVTVIGGGMNTLHLSKVIEDLFLWRKSRKISDHEFDEYLLCWVYDYLLVYEKTIKQRNKFIRANLLNIIKISRSPIKAFIKLLLILAR